MAMQIMRKRYGREELFPAKIVTKKILNKEIKKVKGKARKFIKTKNGEKIIIPLQWNENKKIHVLVAPFCIPVYAKSTLSSSDVRSNFLKGWKKERLGTKSSNYGSWWFVKEDVKSSKSKEIQSYIDWRDSPNKENLAFIYLGYFWQYKDEYETINEAAERFFKEHSQDTLLQERFKKECEEKGWEERVDKYEKAILNDGALIFDYLSECAMTRDKYFEEVTANVWKALCIRGYFPWVKRLILLKISEE